MMRGKDKKNVPSRKYTIGEIKEVREYWSLFGK
jgi:hypothetical protein